MNLEKKKVFWIQKHSHVLCVCLKDSKISLQQYLNQINTWWKFKKLTIFADSTRYDRDVFILFCTFFTNTDIQFVKNFETFGTFTDLKTDQYISATIGYIISPKYFLKNLKYRPEFLNIKSTIMELNPKIEAARFEKIVCPIDINLNKAYISDPQSKADHIINLYMFHEKKDLKNFVNYLADFRLENEKDYFFSCFEAFERISNARWKKDFNL